MKTIATIYTFKTKRFTVAVNALEDCDVDLSFDEDGEVKEYRAAEPMTPHILKRRWELR